MAQRPPGRYAQAPIISNVGSGRSKTASPLERISNAQGQLLNQFQQQLSLITNATLILSVGKIQESQYQLNCVQTPEANLSADG
ncbi:hypothetical protein M8494_37770 [Serratia ureilytica]